MKKIIAMNNNTINPITIFKKKITSLVNRFLLKEIYVKVPLHKTIKTNQNDVKMLFIPIFILDIT